MQPMVATTNWCQPPDIPGSVLAAQSNELNYFSFRSENCNLEASWVDFLCPTYHYSSFWPNCHSMPHGMVSCYHIFCSTKPIFRCHFFYFQINFKHTVEKQSYSFSIPDSSSPVVLSLCVQKWQHFVFYYFRYCRYQILKTSVWVFKPE